MPSEAVTPDRYYFVSTPSAARMKPVQAFRRWVLQTSAGTACDFFIVAVTFLVESCESTQPF